MECPYCGKDHKLCECLPEPRAGSKSALIDGLDAHRIGRDELQAISNLAHCVKNSKMKLPVRMKDYAETVLRMIDNGRI